MAQSIKVKGNLIQIFDNGQLVGSQRIEPNATRSLISSTVLKVNNVTYTPEDILRVPISESVSGQSVAGLGIPSGASSFEIPTGTRASDPVSPGPVFGPPTSLAQAPAPFTPTTGIPQPQYDDYWEDNVGTPVAAGTPGAVHNTTAYLGDIADWQQVTGNEPGAPGGVGPRGPTAAELALEQSRIDADNLATFVSAQVAALEADIDSGRLETEQAIGEFNRRLDAYAEAGKQFKDIQPYTIPIGAEYVPGRQPGGIGERLGIKPRKAEVIQFDPFAQAADIVSQTPVLTDIGTPSNDELLKAIELARSFL